MKKQQQRQPSQGVKNAEFQQPSRAALTFLIRPDFFLLAFSGKKSSLPSVALVWHVIQHFCLPATNKLVASTANVYKFFLFFACGCSVAHLLKRLSFLHCFVFALCKDQLTLLTWVYFSISSPTLLIYRPVLAPVPHCL